MAITDLSHENLGFRAEELPNVDLTAIETEIQGIYLGGEYRRISAIPEHPNNYLRWVDGSSDLSKQENDSFLNSWYQRIQVANQHFTALEEAGIPVSSQRHIVLKRHAIGFPGRLYSVVPRYNDLVELTVGSPAHAPAIADCISRLAVYTEICRRDNIPQFFNDLYKLRQFSIWGGDAGHLLMHDTEMRLSPLSGSCDPRQHNLARLASKTEWDLRRHGRNEEANELYAASVGASCLCATGHAANRTVGKA